MAASRLLIRNGCVITLDPQLGDFGWADVLIEGDTIVAVGPSLETSDAQWVFTKRTYQPIYLEEANLTGTVFALPKAAYL